MLSFILARMSSIPELPRPAGVVYAVQRPLYEAEVVKQIQHQVVRRAMQQELEHHNAAHPREREILLLVIEGKSSAQIGEILFLSPKTVDSYRSRMMRKLGVSELAGLIRLALALGILKKQSVICRRVFRTEHRTLDFTSARRSDHLCNAVHFCLCLGPESHPRRVRNMQRIFNQADEFRLGMVTACVIRDAYGSLTKVGKPYGRQKRRVKCLSLGQTTNTEIDMVKQSSHGSSLPNDNSATREQHPSPPTAELKAPIRIGSSARLCENSVMM